MTYEEEHSITRRVDCCHDCGIPVKSYLASDGDDHCIDCGGIELSKKVEFCADNSCDICGDKVRGIDCYPHLKDAA